MSDADNILFAPITSGHEPWRVECRKVIDRLEEEKRKRKQLRPKGALRLEEMLELYHDQEQRMFFLVDEEGMFDIEFNGEVYLNDTCEATICAPEDDGFSIPGYNLFPNEMSKNFVFVDHDLASAYENSLMS